VYKGFLSDAECDHLVTLVSDRAAAGDGSMAMGFVCSTSN
jgi:hypothetical protein